MTHPQTIQCKRVYEPATEADGYRVLVDKMWPRGIKKEALRVDEWRKELSPSSELRKWFGHEPARWAAFYQKFHVELRQQQEIIDALLARCDDHTLTLLYAAKDEAHNNAVALKMFLTGH